MPRRTQQALDTARDAVLEGQLAFEAPTEPGQLASWPTDELASYSGSTTMLPVEGEDEDFLF